MTTSRHQLGKGKGTGIIKVWLLVFFSAANKTLITRGKKFDRVRGKESVQICGSLKLVKWYFCSFCTSNFWPISQYWSKILVHFQNLKILVNKYWSIFRIRKNIGKKDIDPFVQNWTKTCSLQIWQQKLPINFIWNFVKFKAKFHEISREISRAILEFWNFK